MERLNKVDERYNKVQQDKVEYNEYRNKIAKEVAYQEHLAQEEIARMEKRL